MSFRRQCEGESHQAKEKNAEQCEGAGLALGLELVQPCADLVHFLWLYPLPVVSVREAIDQVVNAALVAAGVAHGCALPEEE